MSRTIALVFASFALAGAVPAHGEDSQRHGAPANKADTEQAREAWFRGAVDHMLQQDVRPVPPTGRSIGKDAR